MIRIAKIILGLAAVLIVVLLAALIGVNLYLQSGPVQERIRLATEDAFGAPVEVRRTTFTPWSGLNLTGLSVPDPSAPRRSLVEAAGFSVRFEWLPLLSQRFVVSQIMLKEPSLSLRQTENGDWILPIRSPQQRRARPGREAPLRDAPPTLADAPLIESPGPDLPIEPVKKPAPPSYRVELQKITIRGGSATFVDRKGRLIARAIGISTDAHITPDGSVSGDVWIADIVLYERLYPRKVRAKFSARNGILEIFDVKAALGGGRLRAKAHVDPGSPAAPPAFALEAELEEVSLGRLISEADGNGKGANGSLQGKLVLRGDPRDSTKTTGFGEFALVEATLEPFDFIRQLGQLFKIDELQLLALEQADLKFEVRDENVWVNDLVLKSKNLILAGSGPVRFNGGLNLKARLLINEKLQRQIPNILAKNFGASEDAGYKQVPFKVTGSLDKPRTDLLSKLTGIPNIHRDLRGLLQGAVQSGLIPRNSAKDAPSPESEVEKPDPAPAPSPTSSAQR